MLVALLAAIVAARQKPRFDDRSVLLEGNRVLLVAGSVHYPRSTPNQWPAIFKQAKENGINAIDTYVFWGEHEKKRGSFNFEGNLDVKRFIKEAQNAGLYVILRIGPFIAAEFNYGGFPAWLRTIPDIQLRTYNQPFMTEMQKWVTFIVSHVKDLLWENGGPVIMLQIENEYNLQQSTFGDAGQRYISWAVEMATSLTSSAIWFACKQDTTPSILNTHNGYYGLSWFSTRPFKVQFSNLEPNDWYF
jgi:beta-galactosidase